MQIPSENVRRLSQPTNDNPRAGDGTGAPGGAGTSRAREVSNLFGRASIAQVSQTRKMPFPAQAATRTPSKRCGTVRARAWAGTHAAAGGSCRWPRSRSACSPYRRSAVRIPSHTTSALRAHDAALAAQSRAAALQLYSLDQQSRERAVRISPRLQLRRPNAARERASVSRISYRIAQARHRTSRSARLAAASAHAVRGRRRRADRDRARREDARRGADEPRQPDRVTSQGEDDLAPAASRAGAALGRRRAGSRRREAAARRGARATRARRRTRSLARAAERERVHRLARGAARV